MSSGTRPKTGPQSFDARLLLSVLQVPVRVKCFVGIGHGDPVRQDD